MVENFDKLRIGNKFLEGPHEKCFQIATKQGFSMT